MLVLLAPTLRDAPDDDASLRTAPAGGLRRIIDAQPQTRRDALADQLTVDGVRVRRYEQLGRYGLQFELPAAPGEATHRALTALGITALPGQTLRIEFQVSAP